MNKAVKESTRNDIRLPKYEKLNCIVRTIREWDDDDCDFFHTEQFCEELINQYCEDEHNKCKVRSWLINLIFAPVKLFQSAYDVFYNSKDKQ